MNKIKLRTNNFFFEISGFGNVNGNFWLGLEALHQLTSLGTVTLRFDLIRNDGAAGYAEYSNFNILSESSDYKLTFGSYTGNIGDGMLYSKDMKFSTYDQDNDRASWNCAHSWRGGWWHNDCFRACLNNGYYNSTEIDENLPGRMSWSQWDQVFGDITFSEMKLRRET